MARVSKAKSQVTASRSMKAVVAGLTVAALGYGSYAAASLGGAERIAFEVLRNGSPIGSHTISFEQQGDQLIVDIEIGLEVKFAFFTVFDYQHRNREVWQDGRLIAIDTQTDNNGDRHIVSGRATDDGFLVNGKGEQVLLPGDIIPTSYWNPATRDAQAMLNTQTGELIDVEVTPKYIQAVDMPWGESKGQLHRISGDLELDLWYDPAGCLLKLSFEAPGDGSTIDYRADYHMAERPLPLAAEAQTVPCES